MMWLMIILFLGVITLLEFTLESVVSSLESHGVIKPQCLEWYNNGTLQLQRMAHEELGLGDWTGCTGSSVIPVTEKGQLLGVHDSTDLKHPRLAHPAILAEKPEQNETSDSCPDHDVQIESMETDDRQDFTRSLENSTKNNAPISCLGTEDGSESQAKGENPLQGSGTSHEQRVEQDLWSVIEGLDADHLPGQAGSDASTECSAKRVR